VKLEPVRRFLKRRAPDLLVAGAIVGWIVACGKKNTAPAQQPAAALAETKAAPPAAAKERAAAEPTRATVAGLEVVAARGECKDYGDFDESMALARKEQWSELEPRVREGALDRDPVPEWLVLAHHYAQGCARSGGDDQAAPQDLLAVYTPLPEALVDRALEQKRCGFLLSLDELELWPYEIRFGQELQERDFAGAEVTRAVWRDSLSAYLDACGDNVSRRQKISAQTRITKLDRIIGLDDSVLIELRSKMLTALERGQADQIIAFSRAINEREKDLDSRHAELYEEKLRDVEAAVAMQKQELAAVRNDSRKAAATTPSATPTPASEPTKTDKTADLAQKTANVAKTAKNVHDTVKTAKSIGKMFGL
jgi:hypothetical protein